MVSSQVSVTHETTFERNIKKKTVNILRITFPRKEGAWIAIVCNPSDSPSTVSKINKNISVHYSFGFPSYFCEMIRQIQIHKGIKSCRRHSQTVHEDAGRHHLKRDAYCSSHTPEL